MAALAIVVSAACGRALQPATPAAAATRPPPTDASTAAPTAAAAPTETPAPTATPVPTPGPEPRIFVASEYTNTVQVWQGEPPVLVTAVPVGSTPHNISASNSGRWIAASDRFSEQVSIIDSASLTEIKRVFTGRRPHDLAWSPDDSLLYVTQEDETFISVIDTSSWRVVSRIGVGTPQHDLAISPDGSEIWVTSFGYKGLIIVDRAAQKREEVLTRFDHGSHDITFLPQTGEAWATSSGFIASAAQVDPFVLIFDYKTRELKDGVPLGIYPFHSVKKFRDGMFLPPDADELWYSDRGLGGVIDVSVSQRKVLAEIKTGRSPFHISMGPNHLLYVANHDDSTMSVVDTAARALLHTVQVAGGPHGVVVIAAP